MLPSCICTQCCHSPKLLLLASVRQPQLQQTRYENFHTQHHYKYNYPNYNFANMQPNIRSTLLILTAFLAPLISAGRFVKECPVCFDNTVRGCDGIGPNTAYYTCYKTPANVNMVATYACDGGCRLVQGQPRCNNGKLRNEVPALPVDPNCPWGLREVNGKKRSEFQA